MSGDEGEIDMEEELNTALAELQAEIDRNKELEDRVDELEQGLGGDGAGETREMLDQISDLQTENETLRDQLANAGDNDGEARQELNDLQQRMQSLQEESERKDLQLVKSKNKYEALYTAKEELSTKLHTEQANARKRKDKEGGARKDAKSHRRELNRVLEENRELRAEREDLMSDRDKLIGAVEQLHEEVQGSRKTLSVLEEEKDDAVKREQIKDEQIKALRHELEETQDERHVLEKIQGDHEAFVEQLKQRHDNATSDVRRRLDHETREVARLQQENERLRDNTQVGALQIRLNKAESTIEQANGEVVTLKTQLDSAADELRKVVEEYIMLEDDFNAKVEEKVQEERRVIMTLKERLEGQKVATEQARDDLMKMSDDKADIERQLADEEQKNKKYEQKHGLEDAVAHQKELKLEIRRRDRELSKINHKLSEQLEANDLLTATLRKLKIDYNLPPDFEYPKLELREEIRSEKERLRADNLMWEQQNSALEAERTNLLQALRTQAQLSSVKGFKEFGLNAEQIVQLNYFATQLKKGVNATDINLPQDNKSRQVIRERDTLKEQLRRTEIKLEMYQDGVPMINDQQDQPMQMRASSQQRQQHDNMQSSAPSPGTSNVLTVASGQEMTTLTNEISTLRRENERLKTELPKIIQESMDEFRGSIQAAANNNNNSNNNGNVPSSARSNRRGSPNNAAASNLAVQALERKLQRMEEEHERERNRAKDEEERLATHREEVNTLDANQIHESMKNLEASMHERITDGSTGDAAAAAKEAISEVVQQLKTSEASKAEMNRDNQRLSRKNEALQAELRATQNFLSMQQQQNQQNQQNQQQVQQQQQQQQQPQQMTQQQNQTPMQQQHRQQTMQHLNMNNMNNINPTQGREASSGTRPTMGQLQMNTMSAQQQFASFNNTAGLPNLGASATMGGGDPQWATATMGVSGFMEQGQQQQGQQGQQQQRYQSPKSPSARIMQARQVASLQLPPEDWADELAGVNGQLIESLEELAQREDEITTLVEELDITRTALNSVHAKETLLYREHIAQKEAYTTEIQRLINNVSEAEAERDQAAVKAARLDQLVSVLETEDNGDGDPMSRTRDAVRELTRRVAVFEVNQAIMSRKYTLLEKTEQELRKNHDNLNRDHTEMLRTLKLRVLYLELWRRGGQAALEEQQRLLDTMVPKDEYSKSLRELDTVKGRFRELLVHEAELRAARAMVRLVMFYFKFESLICVHYKYRICNYR